MASLATVDIQPYPLTHLSITDGINVITFPHKDIEEESTGYLLTIGTSRQLSTGNLTFYADGYEPQTKDCYTDTNHTVVLKKAVLPPNLYAYTNPNVDDIYYAWTTPNAPGTKLYAWADDTRTVYTTEATPTTSSTVYDNTKTPIDATITAVDTEQNTITVDGYDS